MAIAFLHWNTEPDASNGTIRGGFNTYWDPNPGPEDATVTLLVHHSRGSYIMRGFNEVPASNYMMFVDHEAPLNEPLRIEVWIDGNHSAGGTYTLTVAAASPLISDPIRGNPIPVTIQSWPDRDYERAGNVLKVSDSSFPVIIGGFERAPSSTITLIHNQSADSALRLEALLGAQSLVQVRPSCPGMESAWVSARGRSRGRFSGRPDSAVVDVIEVQHVGMPSPDTAAIGNSLLDLHNAEPGTLADIAVRWRRMRDLVADDVTA